MHSCIPRLAGVGGGGGGMPFWSLETPVPPYTKKNANVLLHPILGTVYMDMVSFVTASLLISLCLLFTCMVLMKTRY